MENKQSISKLAVITLVILGLFIAVSAASYSRITSAIAQNQDRQLQVEKNINAFADSNKKQFEQLQAQLTSLSQQNNSASVSLAPETTDTNLLKFVKQQNALIKDLKAQTELIKAKMNFADDNLEQLANQDADVMAVGATDMGLQMIHTQEETERQVEEHYTKVETVFQNQIEDASWSAQVNQKFDHAMTELKTTMAFDHTNVENIDCRTTQCKLEIFHSADAQDPEMFKMELAALMATDFPGSTSKLTKNEDGSVSATYYFFKQQ